MSVMGKVSPVKQRVFPGLARSQSYNLEVDNEATAEMLAERDERIRDLEETVQILKHKLGVCDWIITEENPVNNDKSNALLQPDE